MPSTSRRIKGRDRLVILATGSEVTVQSGTAVYVAAPVATKLAIITQPSGAVDAAAFTTQPVVELQSAGSTPVLQAGVTVTASIVAGAGTLVGTATAVTASNGRATFTNLGIDASAPPASFTLRFSASGLTSVDSNSFTVSAGSSEGEPIFIGTGGQSLVFYEEMSGFADMAAFQAYTGGGGGLGLRVTDAVKDFAIVTDFPNVPNGRALRAIYNTFEGVQQTKTCLLSGFSYSPSTAQVVWQILARFTNGWQWSGDGMKGMEAWFANQGTWPQRFQFGPTGGTHVAPPNSESAYFAAMYNANPLGPTTLAGQPGIANSYRDEPGTPGPWLGEPTWYYDVAIGQPVWLTYSYKPSTSLGSGDGHITMWHRPAAAAAGTGRRVTDCSAAGLASGYCTAAMLAALPYGASANINELRFPDVWNSSGGMLANADYASLRLWRQ